MFGQWKKTVFIAYPRNQNLKSCFTTTSSFPQVDSGRSYPMALSVAQSHDNFVWPKVWSPQNMDPDLREKLHPCRVRGEKIRWRNLNETSARLRLGKTTKSELALFWLRPTEASVVDLFGWLVLGDHCRTSNTEVCFSMNGWYSAREIVQINSVRITHAPFCLSPPVLMASQLSLIKILRFFQGHFAANCLRSGFSGTQPWNVNFTLPKPFRTQKRLQSHVSIYFLSEEAGGPTTCNVVLDNYQKKETLLGI